MAAQSNRTATVLFTDLVGSTELLSRLGESTFDGLRRAHFAALRTTIEGTGGTEVKTTGDGLLATFSSAADAQGTGRSRAEQKQRRADALVPDNPGRRIAMSRLVGAPAVSFSPSGDWATRTTDRESR